MDIDFRRLISVLAALVFIAFPGTQVLAKELLFVYPPDGWRLSFETEIANLRFFEYLGPDCGYRAPMEKLIRLFPGPGQ